MRWPAYPRYKASGVEWLGEVPEGWRVGALKHAAEFVSGGTPDTDNEDYWADADAEESIAWIAIADMTRHPVVNSTARRVTQAGVASRRLRVLPPATLVYSMYASLGKTAVLGVPAAFNQAILAIVPRSGIASSTFLRYWLAMMEIHVEHLASSNTQDNLNAAKVRSMPLFVPPLADQRSIVAFLDARIVNLDLLLATKQAMIEKLKEKRSALISRTVTRGLPPEAARAAGLDARPKLKASGVECIGDVPEHWNLKRFRHVVARLDQGWSANADSSPADDEQWGVLKLSAVRRGRFDPSENKALDEVPDGVPLVHPERGDVLVSRSNTPERVGDVCLVPNDYPRLIVPDLLYRLKLQSERVWAAYVCAFLLSKSARAQIEADARGSSGSMVKLGQGHVLSWFIPCPPVPEQRAIADYLDRETAKIDGLIAKVEEAIEKLREYRAALITAAVTGKIDVRGAAA